VPPPDGADRDYAGRQHRLDHAGPDQIAGIAEVEPVAGMNPDRAGLALLQPQQGFTRGSLPEAAGTDAAAGVRPQHAQPDDDRHRKHDRGEMPEELHRDRP
jgi:hypothetical protein